MTAWPVVRIGEFAKAKGGKRLPKGMSVQDSPTPYRYLRVVDMSDDRIDAVGVKYITPEAHEKTHRYVITEDDVYISIAGTIGRVGVVPPDLSGCHLTENAAKITEFDGTLNQRFLAYFLRSPMGQAEIAARTVGTSQPKLALFRIEDIPVPRPHLPIQRKIAAVLAAYDELIENNLRRIQILEEMAQTVYREWFVNFRFPGYEDVAVVDSPPGPIPEGWDIVPLAELAKKVVDGDWVETKDQGGSDYRLLQVSNIGIGRFRETGNYRYVTESTFERLRCTEVHIGDILISRMPDPVGRAWLVDHLPESAITAVDVAILTPVNHAAGVFLEQYLNSSSTLAQVASVATGTTRLRVTRRVLAQLQVVRPSSDLLDRFSVVSQPNWKLRSNLSRQVKVLREIRNLLLPKLVSGELDVSDLDIDTGWLAS